MSLPPVVAPTQRPPIIPELTCTSKIKRAIEVIGQVAIRALFIIANIFIAGVLLPIAWHWIALPIVTIGSTALAVFFFPGLRKIEPEALQGAANLRPQRPVPLRVDARQMPENYPVGGPVGFRNGGGNDCAFNATAHLLDSDPLIAQWMRTTPLGLDADREAITQFLRERGAPDDMINQWQQYRLDQHGPAYLPIFEQFLSEYQPPAEIREIRGVYQLLQHTLPEFYAANDDAIENRRAVSGGNSGNLRAALREISTEFSAHHQEDAAAILTAILDQVPEAAKIHVESTTVCSMTGLPPLAEQIRLEQTRTPFLTLPLDKTVSDNTPLDELAQKFYRRRETENEKYSGMGTDGQRHDYPIIESVTEFVDPPPALRFQLKRFTEEPPIPSLLSRWLPWLFSPIGWRAGKLDTKIKCPDEMTIQLKNGNECRYRLASFVTHHGGRLDSGHYTSGEIRNGQKYLHNDSRVTWVDSPETLEKWNEDLRSAYLLCYIPVQEDPAAPVPGD